MVGESMPGEALAKRERMFDRFATQPGHEEITHGRFFFCPLCRKGPFSREATGGENPLLTLAHIVPDSLGGTWTTLACAECNNGHGHRIETDLLAHQKVGDWLEGRGQLDVRMGDDKKIRAESHRGVEGNGLNFEIRTPMASPSVQAHKAQLENLKPGDRFQVTMPWFRPDWVCAAVCQSAYLLMFRWFGYDFARNPQYNFVRDQILRPDSDSSATILEVPVDVAEKFLAGQQAGVVFTRGPMQAILAVLRFRSPAGREQVLAVAMPGPGDGVLGSVSLSGITYGPLIDSPEVLSSQKDAFVLSWRHWVAL